MNLTSLPKVRGLSNEQQQRLDVELTARKLTTAKAQRAKPGEVVAALQAALGVDATNIMAAYGDYEAKALQVESDMMAIEAVNAVEAWPAEYDGGMDEPDPMPTPKRTRKRTTDKLSGGLPGHNMED